jgi:hypothetical protein
MDHGGGNLSETQISRQTPSLPAYFDALDHVGTILTFIYARVGKCPAGHVSRVFNLLLVSCWTERTGGVSNSYFACLTG